MEPQVITSTKKIITRCLELAQAAFGWGRGEGMRPSLVDWIVTRAGQIPESNAPFRSLTGSGFFSDAHSRERDPSGTIQSLSSVRAPKRGVSRGSLTRDCTAASPPGGLASRAAAEAGQRSASLSPRGAVTGGRTPRRTWRRERGWARRARSPGSRACSGRPGARRRARPGASSLPGPGGGDPRLTGAAGAQRRGWQGRPSRFGNIAVRLSQLASVWPRLPPRPPGEPSPSGDQGRARPTTLPEGSLLVSSYSLMPGLGVLT
ncbi:hypothetical protein HispidOSU_019791 [Sigmodon hispidus]